MTAKLYGDEPKTVYIEAEGECEVTAGDIKADSEVNILDPGMHIATLGKDAKLYMEITIDRGRGYVSAERNKKQINLPVDVIAVDSIYTPVLKVNYTVEDTRLGQVTDYDKLTLEVWTDGTISAKEAISQAANLLNEHLKLFIDLSDEAGIAEVLVVPLYRTDRTILPLFSMIHENRCQPLNFKSIAHYCTRTMSFNIGNIARVHIISVIDLPLKTFLRVDARSSQSVGPSVIVYTRS